jgi:aerobic carbon-monoxide dehydrogenase large subunit
MSLPESAIEVIESDLAIDPVELRRKNLISSREMPYALPQVHPYGSRTTCDSGDYAAALDRCLTEIGWARLEQQCGASVAGKYHGVGVGCYIEGGGSGPASSPRGSIGTAVWR